MKYIVLSFDDGRKDFYTNAFPILKKYQLKATLNVVTGFLGRNDLPVFASANYACLSTDEMKECAVYGIEIANHSVNHTNDLEQIIRGTEFIYNHLKTEQEIGFASPSSEISKKNIDKYKVLIKSNKVLYIRSGNQIKRDGLYYAGLYILYRASKSKKLFNLYNKRNIICPNNELEFYPSITCSADNTMDQIISFIQRIPDEHAAIIMFHSILNPFDLGWGKDKWYNSVSDFENLCDYLAKKKNNISVITNAELCGMSTMLLS